MNCRKCNGPLPRDISDWQIVICPSCWERCNRERQALTYRDAVEQATQPTSMGGHGDPQKPDDPRTAAGEIPPRESRPSVEAAEKAGSTPASRTTSDDEAEIDAWCRSVVVLKDDEFGHRFAIRSAMETERLLRRLACEKADLRAEVKMLRSAYGERCDNVYCLEGERDDLRAKLAEAEKRIAEMREVARFRGDYSGCLAALKRIAAMGGA